MTIPDPRGRKSRPTIVSSTEDLPEDCDPTTTIWGRSTESPPMWLKVSWSLLTREMRSPSDMVGVGPEWNLTGGTVTVMVLSWRLPMCQVSMLEAGV